TKQPNMASPGDSFQGEQRYGRREFFRDLSDYVWESAGQQIGVRKLDLRYRWQERVAEAERRHAQRSTTAEPAAPVFGQPPAAPDIETEPVQDTPGEFRAEDTSAHNRQQPPEQTETGPEPPLHAAAERVDQPLLAIEPPKPTQDRRDIIDAEIVDDTTSREIRSSPEGDGQPDLRVTIDPTPHGHQATTEGAPTAMTTMNAETTKIGSTRTYFDELAQHTFAEILPQIERAQSSMTHEGMTDPKITGPLSAAREAYQNAIAHIEQARKALDERHTQMETAVHSTEAPANIEYYERV
ncbi:MAG: hypothetical protein ACREQ5_04720, partial [Candidatus Dormibacteria bacterium]